MDTTCSHHIGNECEIDSRGDGEKIANITKVALAPSGHANPRTLGCCFPASLATSVVGYHLMYLAHFLKSFVSLG
jgi:hypothetical protein